MTRSVQQYVTYCFGKDTPCAYLKGLIITLMDTTLVCSLLVYVLSQILCERNKVIKWPVECYTTTSTGLKVNTLSNWIIDFHKENINKASHILSYVNSLVENIENDQYIKIMKLSFSCRGSLEASSLSS